MDAIRGSLHLGKCSGAGDVKIEEEGALQSGGLSFNLLRYLSTYLGTYVGRY